MKISGTLNGVYDEMVGWRPASGSTKPAHVANGLFRELCGKVYDISALVLLMYPERKGRGKSKKKTLLKLKSAAQQRVLVGMSNLSPDDTSRDKIRIILAGILGSEGAASFGGFDRSSLTVATSAMVSEDNNDRHIGRFFGLLLKGTALEQPILSALQVQNEPQDPLTCAAWPLLDFEGRTFGVKGGGGRIDNAAYHATAGGATNPSRQAFIRATRYLASHENAHGNRLRTLQRTTVLCCFGVVAQIQYLAADGASEKRTPLLLTMDTSPSSLISRASRDSFSNLVGGFERFLMRSQASRLRDKKWVSLTPDTDRKLDLMKVLELPDNLDETEADTFLRAINTQNGISLEIKNDMKPSNLVEKIMSARMRAFREAVLIHQGQDTTQELIADIYGMTMVRCYLDEYTNGGPQRFLSSFLSRIGILFPRRGSGADKRLWLAPSALETMTRCCYLHGEQLTQEEFLDRLWDIFGIVIGGGSKDSERLRLSGIDIDSETLNKNSEDFLRQLDGRGLASRYADGVTFIGDVDV